MVDSLVPLTCSLVKFGGTSMQITETFNPHLSRQTAEEELTDRFGVTENAVIARDESTIGFQSHQPGDGIVAIEKGVHDGRFKRREDSSAGEQFLLRGRLGVEEGLDLEVEGGLFFRQL